MKSFTVLFNLLKHMMSLLLALNTLSEAFNIFISCFITLNRYVSAGYDRLFYKIHVHKASLQ